MSSAKIPRETIKTLFIACDHAGLLLKDHLIHTVPELPWEDLGTSGLESVDYPDYADKLAKQVKDDTTFGVLVCGSGQGMAIRANRYSHIRAALCWNQEMARLSRQHNNANVLCFGARTMDFAECEKSLLVFLSTAFEGDRHQKRVDKLWSTPTSES